MNYLADVLKLGSDNHGSFALSESKTNLLSFAIDHHLKLISTVIDNDLVPQTLLLNGWNLKPEEMPKLTYTELEDADLDMLSKFIQRISAVGMLPVDPDLINEILNKGDFDYRVPAEVKPGSELYNILFPKAVSRSGDGMESGLSNGTGGGVVDTDPSALNLEN